MPTVPLPQRLSPLDLALVALYLVAITVFGLQFRSKSKDKSLKSYFLANNTIPWWAIALSIVSAETSTLTIISIPGVAFTGDFGFLQVVFGYMLGRIVVAFLFLPRYFRGEMLTAYQLIDRRFGPALHKLTAGLFLLTRAAAEGVRVFAISIVVGIAIGTRDVLSIAIISALTLLYTFEGGMAAVIWTDVVQMALYVAGTVVAVWSIGTHVPGGWFAANHGILAAAAHAGKFHLFDFSLALSKSYTFWAGVLGGTFLTMASHGTDQLMVQRLLAAKNLRESRLALLSSGAVIFIQFTLFLLIGAGLYVFYAMPGAENLARARYASTLAPDRLFPTFIVQQMPHGISGLLVAAILAAAMSNLSAALNSLASTTVIDFYLPFKTRVPRPHEARVGEAISAARDTTSISRLATFFWAVILFLIAVYSIHAGQKAHVVEIALSIASVAYGCLLGVFLLGTLTRRSSKYGATQTGAIVGMVLGFATNLLLWQFPHTGITVGGHHLTMPNIAFTWYVLIGSAVTFAVGILASVAFPRTGSQPRLRQATAALLVFTTLCFSSRSLAQKAALRPTPSPAAPLVAPRSHLDLGGTTKPYDFTSITALLTQAIAKNQLPGAVVVIGHNGKIVFEQAYGNRKLPGEPGLQDTPTPAEPMTEDTLFDMASLTKVMVTTVAILQLYEQGKLDLDAPVSKYLPQFISTTGDPNPPPPATRPGGVPQFPPTDGSALVGGVPSTSTVNTSTGAPGGPDTVPTTDPGAPLAAMATLPLKAGGGPPNPQATTWKSHITIRELLTHYSGLPEDVSLKDPWGLAYPDKAEGIRRAMAAVPYGPPNLTFKYSDINFITLGVLVETLTGAPLDVYFNRHILEPLLLSHSSFLPALEACGPTTHLGNAVYLGKTQAGQNYSDCDGMWFASLIADTAPTTHDNEGTPQTNPNYDHLLRGTVHDPTTRRMGGVAGHAGLFSNAHDAALFCQALLDKVNHGTGPFPLKQSTLQMALRPQAPATAVSTATIFTQDQTPIKGVAQRALGWDLNSAFSRPRGELFPITTLAHPGSFGHTGFTGTSLWLDPASDTYIVLLANAIHPRGNPPISALRGQVATAAARALGITGQQSNGTTNPGTPGLASETPATTHHETLTRISYSPSAPQQSYYSTPAPGQDATPRPRTAAEQIAARKVLRDELKGSPPGRLWNETAPVLTGIDVLEQTHYAALKTLAAQHGNHLRIALLTNQSGVDSQGHRTIDLLLHADPTLELKEVFTPEHGLLGKQDTEHLKAEEDPTTHLPVLSLYGAKAADRHPKQSDLRNVDAVVIDLQDAGVRFWTYTSVLGYFLEAAAKAHLEIVVLDRPNPIGGIAVQGPTSDPGTESYVNFMPIPVRHGMTFGELARFYNANAKQVDLDPALLDARAVTLGVGASPTSTGDPQAPPATQPGLHAALTVVPMQNWRREDYFEDTGVPWLAPSPNLRTPRAAILYPAIGLIETTNVSVGRGTPTPFEDIGAPYLDAKQLASYLEARHIPGIRITPTSLTVAETPEHYPSHGQTIPGIHFEVTDRTHFDSPEFGGELLAALHHLYPQQFQLEKVRTLLLNADTQAALKAGEDPRDIANTWQPALNLFIKARAQAVLY